MQFLENILLQVLQMEHLSLEKNPAVFSLKL